MGYAICTGPCICCNRIFSYNPNRVPSTRAMTGKREPICRDCFEAVNLARAEKGMPPFALLPDAYEPIDETLLSWDGE